MNNENLMLLYYVLGIFGMFWGVVLFFPDWFNENFGVTETKRITTTLTLTVFAFLLAIGGAEFALWYR
jgi:cytochrome c biogenesis protein CcdA